LHIWGILNMKRVVTGFDNKGTSIFISQDKPIVTYENDSVRWTELWSSYPDDSIPIDPPNGPIREGVNDSVFPSVGKSIFRVLEFLPSTFDPSKLNEQEITELKSCLPGLLDHVEIDDSEMHATGSVDYGVILSGKITLELDEGEVTELGPGDVFVQNGTRHAWRVEEKCTMAVVLVGVERKS
jgi:mannose-6-phosphate isomerase-like protein (cupin superfamily)